MTLFLFQMGASMYRILICSWLCMILVPAFAKQDVAIFAGGGFWSMEADFRQLPGVVETVAGFDGGKMQFPTYQQVETGKTKYAQCVKVVFDRDKISYRELVEYYFKHIDPTAQNEQFCDRGRQYRSAIFYLNADQ